MGDLLPKLIYIGDVPVEASYHGSMLIYRLLQNYPVEQVQIIETTYQSLPQRRLPGVAYSSWEFSHSRLLATRFRHLYATWLALTAGVKTYQIKPVLKRYTPRAILTVTHGYSWLAASVLARQLNLPLCLLLHDDWPNVTPFPSSLRDILTTRFASVYRQALARFCVSPYMEEDYKNRYGVSGTVLYPLRGPECPIFSKLDVRTGHSKNKLTVAFAGTINSDGYARLLRKLAECLRKRQGKLLILGPYTEERLRLLRLDGLDIECGGSVPSTQLTQKLRQEADILFVPMSFEGVGHCDNMRLGFPSKLTDYTATGLPLLICGPSYCSAVRWAEENAPVAEVVTEESNEALEVALNRLSNASYSKQLAERALEVGTRLFSHSVIEEVFFATLRHVVLAQETTSDL